MQKKGCCAGLMLFCWLSSCAPSYTKYITTETGFNRITAPDYTELQNWAAHPGKTDVSDSIPYPLLVAGTVDTTAAVFFIHPTTLISNRDTSWNASLENDTLNTKTDYSNPEYLTKHVCSLLGF